MLRRRVRNAVSTIHDLKMQADLVSVKPIYGFLNENDSAGLAANDYFQLMTVGGDGKFATAWLGQGRESW